MESTCVELSSELYRRRRLEDDAENSAARSISDIIRRKARVTLGGILSGKLDSETKIIISDKTLDVVSDKKTRRQKHIEEEQRVRSNQFMGWWSRRDAESHKKKEHDDAPVKLPESHHPELPDVKIAPSLVEMGAVKLLC